MPRNITPPSAWLSRIRRGARTPALVLVLGLVLGAIGFGWGVRQDQVDQATALILLNPLEGNPFGPDGTAGADLVDLETEAQLVASQDVAGLVAERRGTVADDELDGLAVAVPPNTQLLEITVTDASGEAAATRAQDFAETYLEYRKARSEAAVFDRTAGLREQIAEQGDELRGLVAQLGRTPGGSPSAVLVRQQIVESTTQLGQLRLQAAGLEAAPIDPGQVVSPASEDGAGPLSTAILGGLVGLAAGVIAGIAWAVSRRRLAGWVRSPDDLADAGAPVLATVTAATPTAEAIAPLRAGVLARRGTDACVTVVAGMRDRVVTSWPLGESLARANLEVVVVDAAATTEEGGPAALGLTDLVRGNADIDRVLHARRRHLNALGAGTCPADLDDLVMAPEMSDVVGDLGKRADLVVLEVAPATDARAQGLAGLADQIVLEVEVGRATLRQVVQTLRTLTQDGTVPAGIVLVVPPRWRR